MKFDEKTKDLIYSKVSRHENFGVNEVCDAIEQITERKIPTTRMAVLNIPVGWNIEKLTCNKSNYNGGSIVDLNRFPELEPLCTVTDEIDFSKLVGCVVMFEYRCYTYYGVIDCSGSDCIGLTNRIGGTNLLFNDPKEIKKLEILRWKDGEK